MEQNNMEFEKVTPGPLLAKINSPDDLKKLKPNQLIDVCDELRDYIIGIVSIHGGHFGASLGVVEMTVALHYVYDTPNDLLLWDVGHQAYGHKILTGRREEFHTNRKHGGLSGFPKRSESKYDTFGVGHSSTSISAGLGMAVARDLNNSDKKVVSVIGDGAMTAGLAFEAMNNAGAMNSDILVILNDNCMSIDPNVGALKEYLTEITTSKTFNKLRDEIYDMLGHFKSAGDKMRKVASRLEKAVTAAITPGGLFQALGFKYYGPVDGHNVDTMRRYLEDLKDIPGPKLLHVVTVKGKGFAPAEREQTKWHAQSSPFDKITGKSLVPKKKEPSIPKYQQVFGDAIVELADEDEHIVGITPAMPSGSSLLPLMNKYPDRAFDVGIAEQHAITFAAGLAAEGKKAFAAIYSSFLQRAYDQVIHDVAIQKLPVVFCIDRAGLVGADGPTHHGLYDISYLRAVPNIVISSPLNEQELRDMMYTASKYEEAAWAIRYPRGKATGMEMRDGFQPMKIGKGECLRLGDDVAVLSFGPIGKYVIEAADDLVKEDIKVSHFNMRFAKPLDTDLIDEICHTYEHIITIEDGTKLGGFGSAVAEYLSDKPHHIPVSIMGVPDRIIEHGTQEELHRDVGLDSEGIKQKVREVLKSHSLKA
ncbi:MAG TPA: 1-deoxy-D-xylulose-5-phosphate synthase [Balneolaceae bacterium]|nr:1-deoxy-D-xylulose-5-phosphate synthase [Balneolaceae bacterium]